MNVNQLMQKGFFKKSQTEEEAIAYLQTKDFKSIKSIGISTAGFFEGFWAEKGKKVVATTLDEKGVYYTKNLLKDITGAENLELRIEDASRRMPEEDNTYDIIYSRLCFHYLSNANLKVALQECYRVLKKGGELLIIVKSLNDWTAKTEGAVYEEETGFTITPNIKRYSTPKRRLHSITSIQTALRDAGFEITHIRELEEKIYEDYERQEEEKIDASVIEVYAKK